MANYPKPNYVKCKECGCPITDDEVFSNFVRCNRCQAQTGLEGTGVINPYPVRVPVEGEPSYWEDKKVGN